MATKLLWANVYEISQRFGGPEEGGWYFKTGLPIWSDGCVCRCTDRTHKSGFRFDNDKVIPCPFIKMLETAEAIASEEAHNVSYGWDKDYINRDAEEKEYRGERVTGKREVRIESHRGKAFPEVWPHYE